ncbi:hypothetical protein K1719_031328 [Acacia pycnantha]|nr:hypothetical protein K1719_031328 [Acacia pycnantha]
MQWTTSQQPQASLHFLSHSSSSLLLAPVKLSLVLSLRAGKRLEQHHLHTLEIYGSVTMSNMLSLSVFLGLVYIRGLTWNFSSEVLIILIVCTIMGLIASFRTTFPLWMSFIALALYPFSLLLIYILDYDVGLA